MSVRIRSRNLIFVQKEIIDTIADQSISTEEVSINKQQQHIRKKALLKALSTLNEREKKIITFRKLAEKPTTLEELSIKFQVSSERIRQIEEVALKKIKNFIGTHHNR